MQLKERETKLVTNIYRGTRESKTLTNPLLYKVETKFALKRVEF